MPAGHGADGLPFGLQPLDLDRRAHPVARGRERLGAVAERLLPRKVGCALLVLRGEVRVRQLPDVKDDTGTLHRALEFSNPQLEPVVFHIDPDTHLVVKQTYVVPAPGQPVVEELFGDYRPVGGVQVAHTGRVRQDGETLLERHPAVHQAYVMPFEHALKDKVPYAFVVLRKDASATEEELKRFALANGPAYQHPRRVFFLPELPLAGTNKVDRERLRKWVAEMDEASLMGRH